MRFLLCIFFSFAIIGCGTTSKVNLSAEIQTEELSFSLSDDRPAQQKLSINNQDPSGKNYYFGDDNLNPSGPQLMKAVLQNQLGSELSGKTISLSDFVIYVFEPATSVDSNGLDSAAASVPGGYAVAPLAELLILAIESIKSEKNVTVQISGKISDTSFSTNTSENFKGRVTENNIKDTVNKALEDVVLQIRTIIAKK